MTTKQRAIELANIHALASSGRATNTTKQIIPITYAVES